MNQKKIKENGLPEGFVFLKDIDPTILENPRYFGSENFTSKPVPGYTTPKIILTFSLAQALKKVQLELKNYGYKLVIYDAYRPQRASDFFIKWAEEEGDPITKRLYYPNIDKKEIFNLGYVAKRSGHSRGSTVDLTIISVQNSLQNIQIIEKKLNDGRVISFLDDGTVDMGLPFDLLDEASFHDSHLVSQEALNMRNFLKDIMKKYGFRGYEKEWWHYTLENEPYPDTYFDFVV